MLKSRSLGTTLRVVLLYTLLAAIWIAIFDYALGVSSSDIQLHLLQDAAFLILTSLLLFFILRRSLLTREIEAHRLRESEERYRTLSEAAVDAIFITDRADRIVYVNEVAAQQFGLSRAALLGQPLTQLFPPAMAQWQTQNIHRVFESRQSLTVEGPAQYAQRQVWLSTSLVPLLDEAGAVRAVMGVARDLTLRREAELILQESEERFRMLAENAQDVIYRLYYLPALHYEYVSPSLQNLLGFTPKEFYENPALAVEIIHPDDREALRVAGPPDSRLKNIFVARLRRKDGREIWVETHRTVAFDGAGRLLWAEGVMRDITERKLSVDRLRLQSTALEAAANAILITDPQGKALWVNPAFTRFTGYALDEMYGQNPRLLKSGLQDEQFYRTMWTTITQAQVWQGELVNRRKDGTLYHEEMVITPVLDAEGDITNFVAIKQDVTERKRAEETRSRLVGILETTTDLVATFDLQGRLLYLNQAGRQMLKLAPQADLGSLNLFTFYSPWAKEILNSRGLPTALAEGLWSGEMSLIDQNQQEIPVSHFMTAHKNSQGDTEYLSSVMRDIGDRKRREREMVALVALTTALRIASTHAEMFPLLLDRTMSLLKVDGVFVVSADTRVPGMVFELGRGEWAAVANTHFLPAASLTRHVMASLDVYVSNDVAAEARFEKSAALNQVKSAACAPLIAEGQAIGALWIGRRAPGGDITENDLMLLDAVASIAGNAIYRATLYEQTQLRAEQLAAVNSLGRALTETFDLPRIYHQLSEAVGRLLPSISSTYILLYEAGEQALRFVHAMVDSQVLEVSELPLQFLERPEMAALNEVIRQRQPLIFNDLAAGRLPEPALQGGHAAQFKAQAMLGVPLSAHGKVIGVVQVQSEVPQRFVQDDADLLGLVASTAAIAIENARLFAETAMRMEYLLALRNIDQAISASVDTRFTLNVVLDQVRTQLHVDAADVLLSNNQTQTLEYAAGKGFKQRYIEHPRLRLGEGFAGRAAFEHRSLFIPEIARDEHKFLPEEFSTLENFVSYYVVPLIVKGKIEGVLEIFHRTLLKPTREWQEFLESLAAQAAVAIDNAQMFERLQRSNVELTLAYDTTLEGWSHALDLRDHETEGHTLRVTELTVLLGKQMGLTDDEIVHMRRGAILHDIGKIGVPDNVLLKPAALTPAELEIMQRHPLYAYEFLSSVPFLRPALDIPYCHHEHYDGHGYPRGLTGEEIPLAARIFAVVDVWDALRSDRPYRAGWSKPRVCDYLREESGKYFDPKVVDIFLNLIAAGLDA